MTSPDSSHGVSRVVHHRDFYLRGGDMTVLVETHVYRIHSYFFHRESPFFRQMLSESNAGAHEERGTTDQNAYTLDDVKSEDFARFLWVFYNPKYSVYDAPLESWLKIIQLADSWMFDSVKELSVRELEKLEIDPVEKIATYHDNKISRLYLIPSYVAVSKRDHPLTLLEGNRLGMETVLRLAEARERLRQQAFGRGIRSPTSEDFDDAAAETLVREIFNLGSRSSPAPAPATATTTPTPASVTPSTNGTLHSAVRADPAPPNDSSRTNGAPPARAWAAEPRSSLLDSSSTSASTTLPHTGNSNTTNGRTNTTNGHTNTGNATNSNTNTANTTNGHTSTPNGRTSAHTGNSATGSKVSGSGLNKFNFPNTTFRQAKEQLRGGTSGDAGGK